MSKIVQIVKSIAKDRKHPTFTERYHIYYDNGDSLSRDTHQLTKTMCKFIATHKPKEGDTFIYAETGFICKEIYYG